MDTSEREQLLEYQRKVWQQEHSEKTHGNWQAVSKYVLKEQTKCLHEQKQQAHIKKRATVLKTATKTRRKAVLFNSFTLESVAGESEVDSASIASTVLEKKSPSVCMRELQSTLRR